MGTRCLFGSARSWLDQEVPAGLSNYLESRNSGHFSRFFYIRHSFDIHVTTAMMVICLTDSLSASRRWLEKKLAVIDFVDGSFL